MADQSPDFQFHYEWMAAQTLVSRSKIARLIKGLKEKGYVHTVSTHHNGRFTEKYISLNRNKIIYNPALVENKY